MQLKKILFSILVAIMMFSLVTLVATANNETNTLDLVAEFDSATESGGYNIVKPGETFNYVIKIASNPGISALQVKVSYDTSVLDYVGSKDGVIFTSSDRVDIKEPTDGVVRFLGMKAELLNTLNDGVVVTLQFKVNESFDGDITSLVVVEKDLVVGSTANMDTVPATVQNIGVIKAHNYSDAKVIAPTCTEAGRIEYACTKCDDKIVYEDTEHPATGHTEPTDFTVVTPATCTEAGMKQKACTVCATVLATEEIAPKGHNLPDTWTQTVAPTVDAQGEEERKCTECDFKETRPVAKLPKFTTTPTGPWVIGSEEAGLLFVTDALYADFISVSVDGKELAKGNYTVTDGSTKVLLNAEYLDTLEEGEYKLTVTSANGSCETTFQVEKAASTAFIVILVVIVVVVIGVVATVVVLKKKELI